MRRALMIVLAAGVATVAAAVAARADGTYHAHQYALAPVGGAPLRAGFVENIHANGPNVYAHELYVLNGARPDTTYQVVLRIFPGDPSCSSSPLVLPTATLSTNAAGNGIASHVFTPADADGLRGLTVGGMWMVLNGATVDYASGCETVQLD
jgi:hypothetical protein